MIVLQIGVVYSVVALIVAGAIWRGFWSWPRGLREFVAIVIGVLWWPILVRGLVLDWLAWWRRRRGSNDK